MGRRRRHLRGGHQILHVRGITLRGTVEAPDISLRQYQRRQRGVVRQQRLAFNHPRHPILVVQPLRVRHFHSERQRNVLCQAAGRVEGRRHRGRSRQSHTRPVGLRPRVAQRVAGIRVAARAGQGHRGALRHARLVRAGIRGRRLVAVRKRHRQLGRVVAPAVADLHADPVGSVAVGVVRRLEVLRRREREPPGAREREPARVASARGAGQNRPREVGRVRVDVRGRQRRHRSLALRHREARGPLDLRGRLGRRTGHGHARGLRQPAVVRGAHRPLNPARPVRRQRNHHIVVPGRGHGNFPADVARRRQTPRRNHRAARHRRQTPGESRVAQADLFAEAKPDREARRAVVRGPGVLERRRKRVSGGDHRHRHGILVVQPRRVRHLQAEHQRNVLGQPVRPGEGRLAASDPDTAPSGCATSELRPPPRRSPSRLRLSWNMT